MRFTRISVLGLATLALASAALAQSPPVKSVDQIERGVTLSVPSSAPSAADLTRSLQTELKRVGCFESAVSGLWDEKTKAALGEFVRRLKIDVPTDAVTEATIEVVQSRRDRVCPVECGAGRIERNGVCVAKTAPDPRPAAKPQAPEARRAPREKKDDEPSGSGMCWRYDGRGTSLVPCSEAPTGRRAY